MSRRYREPVEVDADGVTDGVTDGVAGAAGAAFDQGAPAAFRWRGSAYRVLAVLGHWREDAGLRPGLRPGPRPGGGVEVPQRDRWRVEAQGVRGGGGGASARGVYDLVHQSGAWRLDRVWD